MLYDKNLIDMICLYVSIDQIQYSVQKENYPVLEEDVEQETTYD